jgi:hypothetical protein
MRKLGGSSCSLADRRGPRTLPVKRELRFRHGSARTTLRSDGSNAGRSVSSLKPTLHRGWGVQESWIRRQGWNAGHESGWLCSGRRGAHVMRRRWNHRGAGTAITLSKPTAHTDGVPADPHEVGSAPGDSQSNGNETESRTLIEPTNRGADTPSRTDTDVIGDEESLAVTDPRGDHPDPDSHCSAESVDCHPVGDYQPIADCKPVAVLVRGGRVCRNKHSFLGLVGAGGSITCNRGSDAPPHAGTPSTSLEG